MNVNEESKSAYNENHLYLYHLNRYCEGVKMKDIAMILRLRVMINQKRIRKSSRNHDGKRHLVDLGVVWRKIIKIDFKEIGGGGVKDSAQGQDFIKMVIINHRSHKIR